MFPPNLIYCPPFEPYQAILIAIISVARMVRACE